jgi:hypothetical protein
MSRLHMVNLEQGVGRSMTIETVWQNGSILNEA